ncbi:MAG: amidohydrolase [Steroidobacteraceae bacterium]
MNKGRKAPQRPMLLTFVLGFSALQTAAAGVLDELMSRRARDAEVALQIWQWAEVGHHEVRSSALLQDELRAAGFDVQSGVAGMPTAFVASIGSGEPVIGLLAEFDALPGFSQQAVPEKSAISQQMSGHACGHHLFGTASVSAGIAVGRWLKASGRAGTVRVYGTPAEEGGGGKVYMARAGLFDDVSAVLHWHPGDENNASQTGSTANKTGKFRFYGTPSHAAAAPEKGRSALDALEAMNFMVNQLREHVPQEARMHYIITRGGSAPNVVPEFAESYLYVRHPDPRVVAELWQRVLKIADAAALGTETRSEVEVVNAVYSILPNDTLGRLVDRRLREVGGVVYDADERRFAEALQTTLTAPAPALEEAARIQPYQFTQNYGSSDVGDVSWIVPTAGLDAATWVPGTPAHSWQAVAAGGMSIGLKGMGVASRTLALVAEDLLRNPRLLRDARAEHQRRRGPDFRYLALVGDREPPLDYRD